MSWPGGDAPHGRRCENDASAARAGENTASCGIAGPGVGGAAAPLP